MSCALFVFCSVLLFVTLVSCALFVFCSVLLFVTLLSLALFVLCCVIVSDVSVSRAVCSMFYSVDIPNIISFSPAFL